MQSEDQIYFLINHKLTRVYVLYRHAKSLRHASPQNRFTLKKFETTTREIGLIIFRDVLTIQLSGLRLYSTNPHCPIEP